MKKISFSVNGMHCESCELLIKDELSELKGISDITIDYKSGKGSVMIADETTTPNDILSAITKAGYTGVIERGNDTQTEKDAVELIKKGTKSKDPMRVVFQSHITADGEVIENDNGKLSFQGKVDNKKSVEVVIPKGKEVEAENYIQKFVKSQSFIHLLDGVNGSHETAIETKQMNSPLKSSTETKETNSFKRVSLSLSGMHCTSCALIIEKSLKKAPGVKEVNVNFSAEKAIVTYDESIANKELFIDVVKQTGYSATFIDEKDPSFEANKRKKEISSLFSKFAMSLVLSLPMIYFMLFDFFSWIPGRAFFLPFVGIISLILTTPVQFLIGKGFYKGAWAAFRMKTFNMDSLIAIGTSVAYFYSFINYVVYYLGTKSLIGIGGQKIPELYFETAAFLITFVI